ncbi:hypothetical protein RAS1_37850 [Phycisphaerae bacterium RAS1]|nr:hypothetical protein RAS1_37850 [Phycisphaerae bacterium RAS1]
MLSSFPSIPRCAARFKARRKPRDFRCGVCGRWRRWRDLAAYDLPLRFCEACVALFARIGGGG